MERFKLRFKRNSVFHAYSRCFKRVFLAYSRCFKRVSCAVFTREERVFICRLKIQKPPPPNNTKMVPGFFHPKSTKKPQKSQKSPRKVWGFFCIFGNIFVFLGIFLYFFVGLSCIIWGGREQWGRFCIF
jgi:hypothetical protein